MEVDTPIESTQSEASTQVVPSQPESIENALPAIITEVAVVPSKIVEQPDVLECAGVSAAADTTTAIVIDSESIADDQPKINLDDGEAIELQSSPSEIDSKEQTMANSQSTIIQSDAIVELESSSNEGDTKDEVANKRQELNSLDLELIDSDSSNSLNDVQIKEVPASQAAQEQSLPTSTVESDVTEIVDDPSENTNNNTENAVHSNDTPHNSVGSINNQTPIEISEKLCTITGV